MAAKAKDRNEETVKAEEAGSSIVAKSIPVEEAREALSEAIKADESEAVCGSKPDGSKEKPPEAKLGQVVFYRIQRRIVAALVTGIDHLGRGLSITYFDPQSAGRSAGVTQVKLGLKDGQCWPDAEQLANACKGGEFS